ncbi:effector-associated domain EAD1-containing protein [Aetokthonos hydrillicola Thurmond2011]|jgi:hypothetical protein|uniref:Effector-associated domain EAD1-containing protein n=1 Tax=Aetokthonos hydrillicola Thurmond2011 TaxID=2712845 RepID=A0AAP5I1B2_9CYAN|nr:effector-associated domain EAD1-containing protein [Aetokthonos hydrillicola]MBO3460153.1 hypothetical protein [Aetokthonos hydrillicola CCALA 1050]MBW4590480.1 hypothetical protein [Aetokthonos hydrillicola CCALA 1050]MDR9893009.1 effector-associated domain EAD1-containing protein [Aetokthonos hydrillicola Thurmond2011]
MDLSGQERKKLQEALIDAFLSRSSLEQMLSFELEKNLNTIAGDSNLEEITFKLIETAKSEGWLEKLVVAASKKKPGNRKLQDFVKYISRNN